MTLMSTDPYSNDFQYKEYSLQQLENWVLDVLNNESLTAQEIYDSITKSVRENNKYHQKELDKSKELFSLLNGGIYTEGQRPVNLSENVTDASTHDLDDFWYGKQYTEEELDAMCDAAAEQEERDKCREYNLREAEYYNQRALADAEYERQQKQLKEIHQNGGFEWTPGT